MCPTRALSLNDDDTLEVDNKSCVRCMHCLNVMTKALKPGDERGVSILIGGKRALKVGDLMGTMIVPFMKLETDEDYEKLVEFGGKILEFFAENALEHERIGETMDRIGLPAFLEAIGVDPDPNMVMHPRTSCYVRTDDFTEEAEKYFERKKFDRAAKNGRVIPRPRSRACVVRSPRPFSARSRRAPPSRRVHDKAAPSPSGRKSHKEDSRDE